MLSSIKQLLSKSPPPKPKRQKAAASENRPPSESNASTREPSLSPSLEAMHLDTADTASQKSPLDRLKRPGISQLPSQVLSETSVLSTDLPELRKVQSPEMMDYAYRDGPSTKTSPGPAKHARVPSVQVSHHTDEPGPIDLPPTPSKVSEPSTPTGFLKHRHSSSTSRREVKETLDAQLTTGEAEECSSDEDRGSPEHHLQGHRRLNQYRLGPVLGKGSAGTVEYAKDDEGREYAVKELSKAQLRKRKRSEAMRKARRKPGQRRSVVEPQDEEDSDVLALIRMEVAIMKKLDHPNLVRLYEVLNVADSDQLYMGTCCICPSGGAHACWQ
jgi:hypothetical protein